MIRLLLCCWLPILLATQGPGSTDIARAFEQLQEQLEPKTSIEKRLLRREQVERLQSFVEKFSSQESLASSPELLKARTRLASLCLSLFDLDLARQQFTVILKQSAIRDRDLRPRALYGLGQVQELEGRFAAASNTLRRILRRHEGTRYATYAKIALLRINAKARAEIGKLTPAISPHLDITGKARDLASLLGAPALLLFWSPDHPAGLVKITELLTAAANAGLAKRQILSFGMHQDTDLLRETADERGWSVAVIPLGQEFLDPVVLKYGIRSVPSNFLIGPDGTLLARDLSPARLAAALRTLK